jgi:hypothetical protein
MRALARIVAGRRTKWLVVLAWVVLAVVFAPLGAKLGDVTDNRTESGTLHLRVARRGVVGRAAIRGPPPPRQEPGTKQARGSRMVVWRGPRS